MTTLESPTRRPAQGRRPGRGNAAAVSLSAFVAGSALAIIVVPVGLALGIATGIVALRTASSTMIGIGARS